MKNIFSLLLVVLIANFLNAQTVKAYFSSTHFEAGKEDQNEPKTQFTDQDFIYGLLVIDQEFYGQDEDPERPMKNFSIGYSFFNGKTNGGGRNGLNRIERKNGKTYIYLDILPEVEHATSKSCKEFGGKIADLKEGVVGQLSITYIEESRVNLPKTKIKGATIKVKRGNTPYNEMVKKVKDAEAQVDANEIKLFNQMTLNKIKEENEKDKVSGKLPKEFADKFQPKFDNTTSEQLKKIISSSKWFPEGSTLLDYTAFNFKETMIGGTNSRDHISYDLFIVFKDHEGFCRYRKIYIQQNYREGKALTPEVFCIGQQYLWGDDAAAIAEKEGSRIFYINCANSK